MAVCRFCLREVLSYLDWSDCLWVSVTNSTEDSIWHEERVGVGPLSYKDCYYKYTQFIENVPDQFTQFICEICASCIRDFHLLVEKSVETKLVLEQRLQSVATDYNEDDKVFEQKYKLDDNNDEVHSAKNGSSGFDSPRLVGEVPVATFEMDSAQETPGKSPRRKHDFIDWGTSSCSEDFKEITVEIERVELCDTEKLQVTNTRRHLKRKCTEFALESVESLKAFDTPYATDVSECDDIEACDIVTLEETNDLNEIKQELSKDLELEATQTKKRKARLKPICEKSVSSSGAALVLAKEKKKKEVKSQKPCIDSIFLCSQCSVTSKNINDLVRHEQIHDKNRERKEVCPKCGLKFFTKLTLKQHTATHDVNREKKYKCDFCDKAFFNRGACNVHMRIHLGKMFPCPLCPKQSYRQIDLDRHMASHSVAPLNHVKPKLKYYYVNCRECGKRVRSDYFREHQAMHMNKPIMQCTLCNKDFFGRAKCNDHMKRHHKRKPGEFDDIVLHYEKELVRISHLMIKQHQECERTTPSQ